MDRSKLYNEYSFRVSPQRTESNIYYAAYKPMRLTTFSDYTLRVLMYLTLKGDELATIPVIAAAYGISENHLTKVVHQLVRAGVVQSVRGKGGGIRLARPPEEIRLGQIVRASEGAAPIVECLGEHESACCIAPACPLSGILVRAFDALYDVLDEYTVADLVDDRRALGQLLIQN
jgi:Rrf2 family nitric oxide-sensitive transcriptional repressor